MDYKRIIPGIEIPAISNFSLNPEVEFYFQPTSPGN